MYIEAAVERCVRSGRAKSGRISLRERRSRLFVVALAHSASAYSAAAASAASPIDRACVAPSATPCSSAATVVPAHGPARSLACRRRSSSSPLAARPPPLSGCARGQSARAQLLDEVSESPWISLVASLGSVDLGVRPSFSLSFAYLAGFVFIFSLSSSSCRTCTRRRNCKNSSQRCVHFDLGLLDRRLRLTYPLARSQGWPTGDDWADWVGTAEKVERDALLNPNIAADSYRGEINRVELRAFVKDVLDVWCQRVFPQMAEWERHEAIDSLRGYHDILVNWPDDTSLRHQLVSSSTSSLSTPISLS